MGLTRKAKRILAYLSLLLWAHLDIAMVHGGIDQMSAIKSTPHALQTTAADHTDGDTTSADAATRLFDRNLRSAYSSAGTALVTVSFDSIEHLSEIRVHGSASYLLTLQQHANGQWQDIQGMVDLDLNPLPEKWQRFEFPHAIETDMLRIQLVATATEDAIDGLEEIEVWSMGRLVPIPSGQALLALIDGGQMCKQGRRYPAQPGHGIIGPAEGTYVDADQDNTFRFDVAYRPDQIKRAFLSYRLSGLAHWTSAIRSVNDQVAMGGYVVEQGEGGVQVEAISPHWLKQGENRIRFVPLSDNERYDVSDVHVLIELDNGANFISYIKSNMSDDSIAIAGLYDGVTATGLSVGVHPDQILSTGWSRRSWEDTDDTTTLNQPVIEIGLDRATDLTGLEFHADRELMGEINIAMRTADGWVNSQVYVEQAVEAGWHGFAIEDGEGARAVRIYFDGSVDADVSINEVRVSGSNLGRHDTPAITISYPDSGQYFGSQAYIRGYVTPADNGSGQAQLYVDNQEINHVNGEFETLVALNESNTDAGSADTDSGGCFIDNVISLPAANKGAGIEIKAVYPDGEIAVTTLPLSQDRLDETDTIKIRPDRVGDGGGDSADNGDAGSRQEKNLTGEVDLLPNQVMNQTFAGAGLNIGKGALRGSAKVKVTTLRGRDLPALDPGMVNVTDKFHGYRFLPHGMRFDKKIKIKLPYAKKLLPKGFTAKDIKTYFYDEASGRWVPLECAGVDEAKTEVTSLTDHFTDMINAVVQAPESPQSTTFNPTQMSDIKAANPAAKINLIQAPEANSQGDAHLSYPIEVPPGRNGMQPQIAVQYSSSGGNGWLGMGWDIPVPAVTIDTRWGVPRYDGALETETYLLNGQQLTPVAHRTEPLPRASEKIFHTRVEGAFQKIIRHGISPDNYWWEVIDKDGTHFFYGGDPGTNRPAENATLEDREGHIAKWSLRQVQDSNGNTMIYQCVRQADTGFNLTGGVMGYALYLEKIQYTGNGSQAGPYEVTFIRDRDLGEPRRSDVKIDARLGFKQVTADLLRKIEVRYNGQMVRSYDLTYQKGAFEKTLLQAVQQLDSQGQPFNRHSFEYFDEARDAEGRYNGFGTAETWDTRQDNVDLGLFESEAGRASAISGNRSDSAGTHIYVGFNFSAGEKPNSVGAKNGFSLSRNKGVLSLTDINGDGLPDKVLDSGGRYRANLSGPNGSTQFAEEAPSINMGDISEEQAGMMSGGMEAYFGVSLGFNWSKTWTDSSTYLSDVNGDGLTDVVDSGSVRFGRPDNPDSIRPNPVFTPDSSATPYPIGSGAVDSENLFEDFQETYQEMLDLSPLHDTLRRWVAPYDGTILIGGEAALQEDNSPERTEYETADGVRLAIQHNGSELWTASLAATDYAPFIPEVPAIQVSAGDRIYFRVQSILDGAYDRVLWNPSLTYQQVQPALDIDGRDPHYFQAAQDFIATGRSSMYTTLPVAGTVRLTGAVEKLGPTSDDVSIRVLINDDEVWSQRLNFDQSGSEAVDLTLDAASQDKLKLLLEADSPIDMAKLQWKPHLEYTAIDGYDSAYDHKGNAILQFDPPYNADVYGATDLSTPQRLWTATETDTATVSAAIHTQAETGVIYLTVKRRNELVAKTALDVATRQDDEPLSMSVTANVAQGDELAFQLSTRDRELGESISSYGISVLYPSDVEPEPTPVSVPGGLYYPAVEELFAQPFRGWTCTGYRGEGERATQPIHEEELVLPDFDKARYDRNSVITDPNELDPQVNPQTDTAVIFFPQPHLERWRGYDDGTWLTAEVQSSSRLGVDYISVPQAGKYAGARAVHRLSENTQLSIMGGIYGASASGSEGDSHGLLDFIDMNGDGFPDVVSKGRIQYSPMTGGLENNSAAVGLGIRSSDNKAKSFGIGGNFAHFNNSAKGNQNKSGFQMPPLSISGSMGDANDDRYNDLIDVNGDGLPDMVYDNGEVALNIGYGFAAREKYGNGPVSEGASDNKNVGVAYNDDVYGWAGGLSLAQSRHMLKGGFHDINGDGLADFVRPDSDNGRLNVSLNTGSGFAPLVYPGSGALQESLSSDQGTGFYFSIGIGPLCYYACYIVINPGFDNGVSMSRTEASLMDIDGDGYPDHLYSTKDNELRVRRNTIGRTNLLRQVNRPLGAAIDIDYQRDGNTYQMPQSRWTMSRVTIHDGVSGDGVDNLATTFRYENGFYHRREREFYGYDTVITEERNAANNDALYRSTVQAFNNDNFYEKGLLLSQTTQDAQARKYVETVHTYQLRDIDSGAILQGPLKESLTATAFPELARTETRFYESQATPVISTYQTFAYDALGNVTRFFDAADSGASDDIESIIHYHNDAAAYIVDKADNITVRNNGNTLRQRTAVIQNGTGNVTQVSLATGGSAAVHNMAYDTYGNIVQQTGPANANGQRYSLNYTYDATVHTYVERIVDSFGYVSSAQYDPHWGHLLSSTDTNGRHIAYTYDTKDRMTAITGPYQAGTGRATITFAYHPEAAIPWALTRHFDNYQQRSNPLETVLFIDGMTRVLQTKKDGAIGNASGASSDGMIVSGRLEFDHAGRPVTQYYPVTESLGRQGQFNAAYDAVTPTRTTYDVIDRVRTTTLPDNTITRVTYGFGSDRDGTQRFETTVTDANNKAKATYRDVRQLITAVKEYNGGQTIWASYRHDPLKQILAAIDNAGNTTTAQYDLLGRRTHIDSPDAGLTEYVYDSASNLTRKITANLRGQGEAIAYDYTYNRMDAIHYPDFSENDVAYTYGEPGAPHDRAGRIVTVTDESGDEERFYGPLGETIKTIKYVTSETEGDSTQAPEIYISEYTYDTYNRLRQLIFPDGETLTYTYNSGGLPQAASGIKGSYTYPYLKALTYDKFEQRVHMRQGNEAVTTYSYNPLNRRLSGLKAQSAGRTIMDLTYGFDDVGNILALANSATVQTDSAFGGRTAYSFGYDDLYRLTSAGGRWTQPDTEHTYTLGMAYDSIHNIVSKSQDHQRLSDEGDWIPQKKTSYGFTYDYGSSRPHAPTHIGGRSYFYDANGNQTGWRADKGNTRRAITRDEENRIQAIQDNGQLMTYKYNDAGQRVFKTGPFGETVYLNPFFNVSNREGGSKHIFVGTSRIASKLVKGQENVTSPGPGNNGGGSGGGSPGDGMIVYEPDAFYYHADHLGSTSYVTDLEGEVYQHLEYFPFGETWVEEVSNQWLVPYLFSAKELDRETGLYYFGARYYDPRTSVWQSCDPILADYLDGQTNNGVYKSGNLGLYGYVFNNPLTYTDPTGRYVLGAPSDRSIQRANFRSIRFSAGARPDTYLYRGSKTAFGYTPIGSALETIEGIASKDSITIASVGIEIGSVLLRKIPGAKQAVKWASDRVSNARTPRLASGKIKFQRWKRGDTIDKPMPDGRAPSWGTVQSRYWKNRYEASRKSGEFTQANLERMKRGSAPQDYNPRTGKWESRELHHVDPQRSGGSNSPLNIRELTPDWHGEVDAFRQVPGVNTTRGIR